MSQTTLLVLSASFKQRRQKMNPGASAFLIFLLIVGAFAGLGYLIPEMNQRTVEIQQLKEQKLALEAELEKTRQMVLAYKSDLAKAGAGIAELEQAKETERLAKEEALARLHEAQEAYNNAQSQIQALQAELEKPDANPSINASSPAINSIRPNYNVILPWLPPVFALALAGGYGFHRLKLSRTRNPIRSEEAEPLPSSGEVQVLVPRERIPEFAKWLRSQ
jgi:Skp family chaperone for outer membrane proteins